MHYTDLNDFLSLLRKGMDTMEIANITGVSEDRIYNRLHEQRNEELSPDRKAYHREWQRTNREELRSYKAER